MADPKDTTGGRDYGRRMYISKRSYSEQKRLASDFHANKWRKHSEYKQPYRDDLEYPEMEGYDWPPWNPVWPQLPDTPVQVDPLDPGGPIIPHEYNPDDPNREFLGCFFRQPLTPSLARPGQTAYARLAMGDDQIIRMELQGPATFVKPPYVASGCNNKSYQMYLAKGGIPYGNVPECTVIIRVNDDISGYEANPRTGELYVVLIAYTASGSSCSTDLTVATCTDESIAPQFDLDSSPETMGGWTDAALFLEEGTGTPPFTWSVSGEGFSFPVTKTTSRVNFVRTINACGVGSIAVTDSCGLSDTYEIRTTNRSYWLERYPFENMIPGPPTARDPYALGFCSLPTHERVAGKWKVRHCFVLTGGEHGCPNSMGCGDCEAMCTGYPADPTWGCANIIDIWSGYNCVINNHCIVEDWGGPCTMCPEGMYMHIWCEGNSEPILFEWVCSS